MFNEKNRLSFFAFLVSLIIVFAWQGNVFSHEKFINNQDNSNQITAQQPEKVVEIKTIPVRGNVYMLTGDGGNIGLCVGDDGAAQSRCTLLLCIQ